MNPSGHQYLDGRSAGSLAVSFKLSKERVRNHFEHSVAFLQPKSRAFMLLGELSQVSQHCGVPSTPQLIREWMQSVVDGGLSVQDWAKQAGVAKSTIFRALKPTYEFTTSSTTLGKLARAANRLPPEIARQQQQQMQKIVPKYLPVRYRVQAGLWYEVDNHPHFEMDDADHLDFNGARAVTPNPRFAEFPQWLELVCGDSANLRFDDGAWVHVVDTIEMGYAPVQGDWVIVERRRDEGRLRERTIKQIEITMGRVVLMPRSSNPRWKEPVIYHAPGAGEFLEVEIVGKVIGFYTDLT